MSSPVFYDETMLEKGGKGSCLGLECHGKDGADSTCTYRALAIRAVV